MTSPNSTELILVKHLLSYNYGYRSLFRQPLFRQPVFQQGRAKLKCRNGLSLLNVCVSMQNVASRGMEHGIAALVPISWYNNNKRGWCNRIRPTGMNPVKTTVRETDIVANNVVLPNVLQTRVMRA